MPGKNGVKSQNLILTHGDETTKVKNNWDNQNYRFFLYILIKFARFDQKNANSSSLLYLQFKYNNLHDFMM